MKFLIDTGANKSYINPEYIKKHQIIQTNIKIKSLFNTTTVNQKAILKFQEFHKPIEIFILKFHNIFDGLIGYETLMDLAASIILNENILQTPNFNIPLNNKLTSCIKPFYVEPLTKVIIEIPINLKCGEFYITPINLQPGLQIQEGIYRTIEPFTALVEIINSSTTPKEVFLLKPLQVEPLNYHEINFQTPTNNESTKMNIKDFIKTEHLNREEQQQIVKLCSKFADIFYKDSDKLTFSNNVKHEINLSNDKPVYVKQYRHPENQKSEIKK